MSCGDAPNQAPQAFARSHRHSDTGSRLDSEPEVTGTVTARVARVPRPPWLRGPSPTWRHAG